MTYLNADQSSGKHLSQSLPSSSSQIIPSLAKGNLWITQRSDDCYPHDSRSLLPIQTVTLTTIEVMAQPSDSMPILAPADSGAVRPRHRRLQLPLEVAPDQTQALPTHFVQPFVQLRESTVILQGSTPRPLRYTPFLDRLKALTQEPVTPSPSLSTTCQQPLQRRKSIGKPIASVPPSNRKANHRIRSLEFPQHPPLHTLPPFSLLIYRLLAGFWKPLLRQKSRQSYVR